MNARTDVAAGRMPLRSNDDSAVRAASIGMQWMHAGTCRLVTLSRRAKAQVSEQMRRSRAR
jgi:hypothetical protein